MTAAGYPKVSVIMPVYNGGKYIASAIDSVLAQSFTDFELLIGYDESTDNTLAIIEEYQSRDKRVLLVRNTKRAGLAAALNSAIANARGRYIARTDADDLARPYRFAEQVAFLDSRPDIAIVGGGYAPFNEKGTRTEIFHPSNPLEIAWGFAFNTFFCHPSVMFRREIVDELGGYPSEFAEDYAFFSRMIRHHKGANLRLILLDYREHGAGLSRAHREKVEESVFRTSQQYWLSYFPNLDAHRILFDFETYGRLSLKQLPKAMMAALALEGKIRRQYQIPLFSTVAATFIARLISRTVYRSAKIVAKTAAKKLLLLFSRDSAVG